MESSVTVQKLEYNHISKYHDKFVLSALQIIVKSY